MSRPSAEGAPAPREFSLASQEIPLLGWANSRAVSPVRRHTLHMKNLATATLAFGAFVLAWSRRPLAAGLCAGLAVDANYLCALVGVVLEARRFRDVRLVYGARHGVRGIVDEDFVDLTQETSHNLEQVANTPSSALGLRAPPGCNPRSETS